MNEDRLKILQMLQENKISVDEATRLLEAAEMPQPTSAARTTRPQPIPDAEEAEPASGHRRAIRFQGAVMDRFNFTGANLEGADFAGQDLQGWDFTGANLRKANLRDANCTGANFTGANLTSADLRNANLTNVSLIGVALRDTLLDGANLSGAELIGLDLRGYKLRNGIFMKMADAETTDVGAHDTKIGHSVTGDMVQV
ncbi:MAG: pentapeptide repeat-containing protein [Caldilineaceae bacterium]